MEAEPRDGHCITIPLLHDNGEQQQVLGDDNAEGNTSFFKTWFNGLKALSGVGILSVPYAVSSGGWLSLTLVFAIAALTFYTGLLIKKCMDVDPHITSYPNIGERVFGNTERMVVSVFMNMELYLVSTGFLILEGDNLQDLLPNMGFEVSGLRIGGKEMFAVIISLVVLPTVWLNNLSVLSYISASGVLASVVILGSVFLAGKYEGIGFQQKGTLLNWDGIPTAVILYAFCYCAYPVFPTLYTSMENKRQFSKVKQSVRIT
ncbi:transmembrane amino acid transporter family protein [Actinidia rufa]|uniref:Transmembrane amino acid transporter family protein n=1 Tax=Actinidia rufa TaxID=165716 RepID=A0A7J0E947_9ERIC|nr:transmembrane amino acid transporter family protein [Actinidia rufa]